ncbi:MAG: hypothetical protein WBG42_12475 [Cryomorphaceae bacterium]
MKKCVLFTAMLFGFSAVFGQSSKTIRTYGISKKTETVIKYRGGVEVSRYIDEVEHYNAEGDWIEKLTYSSGGELKLHQKRIYEDNEVVEEITIDLNGSSMKKAEPPSFERMQYAYVKDEVVMETKISEDGKKLEQKEMIYNKLGDLVEVTITDENGSLIARELTDYNNKGLKTRERLVDSEGVVVKEKIFVYE